MPSSICLPQSADCLSYRCPQPVDRTRDAVRLDRFPPAAQRALLGQVGPLANVRSAPGCSLRFATDSPWVELRLDRLRHHQPFPQTVALTVDGQPDPVLAPDLREREGAVAVRLPTGLERGQTPAALDLWLPPVSTCAIAGLAVADGAVVIPAPPSEPSWLAIGDSLTQGFSTAAATEVWPQRIAARRGIAHWNLGLGGIRIEPAVFAWALADRAWPLVTIALGSNHAWSDADAATAGTQAAELARLACAGGHGRIVWLLPPWKPCEAGLGPADFQGVPLDAATGERVGRVRAAIAAALEPFRPRLEVLVNPMPANLRLLPDGLHPEAHGHRLMADAVEAALFPALFPAHSQA
jgi:lysophospholipase L1-like esterase